MFVSPTLATHQNTPYPNNLIYIFSCYIFLVWVAKAIFMQTNVKVYLSFFSRVKGEEYCATNVNVVTLFL